MRHSFLEAVKKVVYHRRSTDDLGFAHYIPVHLLEDLEYEFKSYCRKHGIRAGKTKQQVKKE